MLCGSLALTYFRAVYLALSSALPRFTVLFGMGRRGSRALWAPDIACRFVARAAKPIREEARVATALRGFLAPRDERPLGPFHRAELSPRYAPAINKVIGSSRTGN